MSARVAAGGCACGAVRFEASGPSVWTAGCCCRDCARASGTPYVVWAGFAPEQVRFVAGAPRFAETSPGVLRGFCAQCGASLSYGRAPDFQPPEPVLYLSAACFDDHDAFPPSEVVWYSQRPHWFALDGSIPLHDTVSPEHADKAYSAATGAMPPERGGS